MKYNRSFQDTKFCRLFVCKYPVTGIYPVFRRNASNLSGAAVRVHLTLASTHAHINSAHGFDCAEDVSNSEDEGAKKVPDTGQQVLKSHNHKLNSSSSEIPVMKPSEETNAKDLENTFAVTILVERAMHLSLKGKKFSCKIYVLLKDIVSYFTAI